MKIPEHVKFDEQKCQLGKHEWSVPRLVKLSENLPVMEIPLDHLNVYNTYEKLTLRQMAMHFKAVADANMYYPIILDEDGEIMDGRHRLTRAMMEGRKSIMVVRFDENPEPCKIIGDGDD